MGFVGEVWRVLRGEETVGEIAVADTDFPWLIGEFTPGPAFAATRHLFDRDLESMDREDWDGWEETYREIRRALTLVSPSGPVAEFILHVEEGKAWFRWSAEPFEES
ncbi:hypothetical protein [Planobispora takensis]|uniref:Uncharacterized protein n=1 Tax=Planobispora takensis TaxID=1367882 RepID=A0A8J3T5R0_9ACTN|nr:hypothetical protein [Planobispora takensis]GII01489.1 hypothetical protein Pta02_34970 [Planobispora takensis]